MANSIERMIADTFMEMAQGLETGSFGKRPKVALTGMGSEHGEENSMAAAIEAAKDGIDVYYIGTLEAEGVTTVKVANDEEGHDKMEEMLKNGEVDAAVTMHFPFPIGVSTVGRCVTPATAKEMFIANTTGTSSTDRIEGMIKNAIYGIIAAKACGKKNPTVGIVNIGAEEEKGNALVKETFPLLKECPDINFIGSVEARDIPYGAADVIVCEAFAGNIILKLYEGVAGALLKKVKKGMLSSLRSKIGALLVKPALKGVLKDFDTSEYGGAPLLGLNGLVVKTHGSSKSKEVCNSIIQCVAFKEQKINEKIKEAIQQETLEEKKEEKEVE